MYCTEGAPNLNVVLTLEKKGSVHLSKNFTCQQNAFHIETVVATAAVGTFTGCFLAGINNGMLPQDAMRYASTVSALAVSQKVAESSIPAKADDERALNSLSPV